MDVMQTITIWEYRHCGLMNSKQKGYNVLWIKHTGGAKGEQHNSLYHR